MPRPSDYSEDYCERVIALGKEGKSRAEIALDLDVSRQTLLNWSNEHPEFLDALNRAKDCELAFFEAKGREGMEKGSAFNAALWAKCVSGRFPSEPYRERVEHTGADGGPIAVTAIERRVVHPD